jgi:hypothetical protein
MNTLSRWLLFVAAVLLLFGAAMHTLAFPRTVTAATASNLPIFFSQSLKALWLIDSVTLIVLGTAFALVAVRPALASGMMLALLALVPLGTAILLYAFLGSFIPAHLLLLAGALSFAAGVMRTSA